jgi:hypothetical protein
MRNCFSALRLLRGAPSRGTVISTSTRFKLGSAYAISRNGAKGTATVEGEALHLEIDDGKDVEIRFDAVEESPDSGLEVPRRGVQRPSAQP